MVSKISGITKIGKVESNTLTEVPSCPEKVTEILFPKNNIDNSIETDNLFVIVDGRYIDVYSTSTQSFQRIYSDISECEFHDSRARVANSQQYIISTRCYNFRILFFLIDLTQTDPIIKQNYADSGSD